MSGSAVVSVRRFPTGRAQSYAGKTHSLDCQSTPAPTHFQIRSAFAPSTHDKSNYHLHRKIPDRQSRTKFSPERTTYRINGSCRKTAPLPHKHAFNVRGIDRDELGVEFHIIFHIERYPTGSVEIGSDGRQHGFDELDVLEKSATLCLLVLPRLPFDIMHSLESARQPATFPDEKSWPAIPSIHQRAVGYFSRFIDGVRRAYTQYTWPVVTYARNVHLLCANLKLSSLKIFLRMCSVELGDLQTNE